MISQCYAQINHTLSHSQQLLKLNCLLKNLVHGGRFSDALHLFNHIHSIRRFKPDHYTLSTALTAAANLPESICSAQLHAHAIQSGLKSFPHVANSLLSLYAKSRDLPSVKRVFAEIKDPDVYSHTTLLSACAKLGEMDFAFQLFDEMPKRSVALWNAVITGCAENGCDGIAIAFHLFQEMHKLGVKCDNYTFASVLSLCSLQRFEFGKQVHCLVIKTGYLCRVSVVNSLLTMYFNGGSVTDGYGVFEEARHKVGDAITHNSIMAGLVSMDRYEEAVSTFKDMLAVGLKPTDLTFVSVMGACFCSKLADQVYGQAIKMRFGDYTSVNNAAISMYCNCRDLNTACLVFERLGEKDIVSWNAIIASYALESLGTDAIFAYLWMQRDGIQPDDFTVGSLLASAESIHIVEMIQAIVIKNALIVKTEVTNALLSAFCRNGLIEKASDIFHDMPSRNLISWNALISGFLSNGLPAHGLQQFTKLLESGLQPNHYTLSLALTICASTSDLLRGKELHAYILKFGHFFHTLIGNNLIALYSKCGALNLSLRVFHCVMEKDTVSWNSIISAYSQYGEGEEAIRWFEAMQCCGTVEPDGATFSAVLSACSHSGLVQQGIQMFNMMVCNYSIEPEMHHFSCVVDLLGRAGYLNVAEGLIRVRGSEIDPGIWWTLLSSCVAHGHLQLGRIVAEYLLETEKDDPTIYVLLSNLYANAGKWEESAHFRELITRHGVMKQPGSSWIAL